MTVKDAVRAFERAFADCQREGLGDVPLSADFQRAIVHLLADLGYQARRVADALEGRQCD